MTIRMLQAWNGLHQQKIVTTLSGSDEAALVAAGIATYDLDGPAENLRMAQLATDAGGGMFLSDKQRDAFISMGCAQLKYRRRYHATALTKCIRWAICKLA
jgi:hypothetical protein